MDAKYNYIIDSMRWRIVLNLAGFGLWLAALIAVIALDTYRKHSLYRALYSLLLRLLIMDGTIRGFLMAPMTPDDYPVKLEVVRRAG